MKGDFVNQTVENGNVVLRAFEQGGPLMYVIAVIGCLTTLLIIERIIALKNLTVNKREFNDNIFGMILRGDIRQAIAFCDSRPVPLTNTVKAGLVQVMNRRPDEEVQVAMDAAVLRETPRLEGWTPFLAVFGNVGVLAGLLGTIAGMIKSFGAVADADNATKALELSKGISHALNCTAFGLMVAIVALVSFAYFQMRISRAENEMIETSMAMLNLLTANRDKVRE
jgi:biopolymer transport protein ExbB/TolQ